ncbi:MAG TPA: YggS family pyridoxal phosphate-dependent enzyme [Candidatus Limnocylindria bacterium]|nr:YggS family pyridoxal phosphate-dependent enzyme [Candidatus Limnocylindria bacterium]
MSDPGATELGRAHQAVLQRIAEACARSGRDAGAVQLLAVSKAVPVERLRLAMAAGITELGENRVQEALAKAGELSGAQWHLVGHLQSNKARAAVQVFKVIQSVDSLALARRLDALSAGRSGGALPVYLQVNIDRDSGKAGFDPGDLDDGLAEVVALANLEVRGLMTVGRLVGAAEEARPTFRRLRELAGRLRAVQPGLGAGLSMGMSDDFEVAVEEGATVVRVGRAIFGERPAG